MNACICSKGISFYESIHDAIMRECTYIREKRNWKLADVETVADIQLFAITMLHETINSMLDQFSKRVNVLYRVATEKPNDIKQNNFYQHM